MKEQLLIIGLVVAFGVGFGVGAMSVHPTATVALPSNYDPTRAVIADALKAQTDATERCYTAAIDKMKAEAKKKDEDLGITH